MSSKARPLIKNRSGEVVDMTEITLPWPPAALSPNARGHWSKLAKAKKAYRAACGWTALAQGARAIQASKLHLTLVFYPPSRRAFDLDNCLSALKAGLDGVADVIKVDDKHWCLTIAKAADVGGYVKIKIEVQAKKKPENSGLSGAHGGSHGDHYLFFDFTRERLVHSPESSLCGHAQLVIVWGQKVPKFARGNRLVIDGKKV
jgi:crossover junction endodeoxyribonuclease RusA